VMLVDKAAGSGGILSMLDRQFFNDHCGMCRILPMIKREGSQDFCLKRGVFHENIEFFPYTEIASVDGAPGDMTVGFKTVETNEQFEKKGVSVVILAGGSDLFDPSETDFYGMSHMPNVVTAVSFERMISGNVLERPSDGKEPKKIAWIQCVGSRNVTAGSPHCSSACCMFAVKEAVLAKEKTDSRADAAIFYMDMRTFGRDFQRYRDDAEDKKGVRFIRCRIHSIEPAGQEGDLDIFYIDNHGEKKKETFSLVVLSTGKNDLNETDNYNRLASADGVYLLESAKEFRDISETVKGAQSAVCEVAEILDCMTERKNETRQQKDESLYFQKPRLLVLMLKKGVLNENADCDKIGSKIENLFQNLETVVVDKLDSAFLEDIKDSVLEKKNKQAARSFRAT